MHEYQSQDITKLAKALMQVQRDLQPAIKDATNPFTQNRYATFNCVMETCREMLLANGIWLCQYPVQVEVGHMGLVTKLTHAESGQWQASLAVVPLPKADPQGYGSCITYAKRYSLTAMLGMVTEDDDGEVAKMPAKQAGSVRRAKTGPQAQNEPPHSPTQGQETVPQNRHQRRGISPNSRALTVSPTRASPPRTDALASSPPGILSPRRNCSWGQASSGMPNARCGGSTPMLHKLIHTSTT